MAKGESEPLMSPGEMKPLLLLSKKQPISCAIGMTRDKAGVILLDKKAKPRKMLGMLKKKAALAKLDLDMGNCRFGQAMQMDSQHPGNRSPAPGMRIQTTTSGLLC